VKRERSQDVEFEVRLALQIVGWDALQRRILAAMVVINDCSLATAEQALATYLDYEHARGYETPCKSNCDVNNFATEAGRLIRRDQRAARARLTVVPGGAEGVRRTRNEALGLAISKRAEERSKRLAALRRVTYDQPVANDGPVAKQEWWCRHVQPAAVQRAKERRENV
jgi:hypothetical protein